MARSSLFTKTDLVHISTRIDQMNTELANLARVLEKLLANLANELEEMPLLGEEITASKAKLSERELYFENYNVLNIEDRTVDVLESAATPSDVHASKDEGATEYLPGYIPHFTRANFPMKVVGDVFYVGNGVTSVVGDAEIPSGIIVDATLVVKGSFTSGENCKLLRDVKALKDIAIGTNTVVEGNLVAGGKVTLGSNCIVHGAIDSEGDIEIGENAVIEGVLCSKSSIVAGQFAKVLRSAYAAKGIST
jgi:cytoskeletal protein CcmA (bactofilin family)